MSIHQLVDSFKFLGKRVAWTALFLLLLNPSAVQAQEVGLLIIKDPSDAVQTSQVDEFLRELGKFWQARYGRVKPSPFPLGYYSLADQKTRLRLTQRFPELELERGPLVVLAHFDQQRPTKLVGLYSDFAEPEVLVRRITSARRIELQKLCVMLQNKL